jgi:hypothetical protein
MSSDDEYTGDHRRRASLATPVPPSAGGNGHDSPRFENDMPRTTATPDDMRRASRTSLTATAIPPTANEVVEADDRVRQVLFSDVDCPQCEGTDGRLD